MMKYKVVSLFNNLLEKGDLIVKTGSLFEARSRGKRIVLSSKTVRDLYLKGYIEVETTTLQQPPI